MKKYILSLFSALFILSCSDEHYENLNRDPNNPTQVSSDVLFTSATLSLTSQMTTPNYNSNPFRYYAQYWTATTYPQEANYDMVTRNIPANFWNNLYTNVLYDLQDAKARVAEEASGAELASKQAQIEVIEVYTWQTLVDAFGNVPYTEALQGKDNPSPAYDDAKTIYTDLFVRINKAIAGLSGGAAYSDSDIIYQGDVAKWKKFANGVKLKLAMRIADVDNATAKANAEAAYAGGLFTSNADNATVTYEGGNENPVWVNLVQSGRSDNIAADTMTDLMNALADPRRPIYFDQNLGAGVYQGGPYGANNAYANYTHVGPTLIEPAAEAILMDYAEVNFMLAQAAQMGYAVGGTVETYYLKAITASMNYWGVSAADQAAYLASPEVAWATAAGDWREKLGTQYWLAMYNRGFEGWTVWRQFDAPDMNLAAESELPVPVRFTYPIAEQNLNKANYEAASSAIGGDTQQTKLFWDKF